MNSIDSTAIAQFRPSVAPNPACCSDPRVLCPACAAKALHLAGVTGNSDTVDREDILPLPTMDYDKPKEDTKEELRQENLRRLGLEPKEAATDFLPLPRMQY